MHAEHPSIHDGAETQIVEHVTAVSPDVARSVLSLTLVVKAVNLRDLARFMIPPDERDPVRVPDFEEQ